LLRGRLPVSFPPSPPYVCLCGGGFGVHPACARSLSLVRDFTSLHPPVVIKTRLSSCLSIPPCAFPSWSSRARFQFALRSSIGLQSPILMRGGLWTPRSFLFFFLNPVAPTLWVLPGYSWASSTTQGFFVRVFLVLRFDPSQPLVPNSPQAIECPFFNLGRDLSDPPVETFFLVCLPQRSPLFFRPIETPPTCAVFFLWRSFRSLVPLSPTILLVGVPVGRIDPTAAPLFFYLHHQPSRLGILTKSCPTSPISCLVYLPFNLAERCGPPYSRLPFLV